MGVGDDYGFGRLRPVNGSIEVSKFRLSAALEKTAVNQGYSAFRVFQLETGTGNGSDGA
jgi:hypothetical protein